MTEHRKAPSGRDIWMAVREELQLNLYELPYSTLCPTVYHVYLHPEDFRTVEGIVRASWRSSTRRLRPISHASTAG